MDLDENILEDFKAKPFSELEPKETFICSGEDTVYLKVKPDCLENLPFPAVNLRTGKLCYFHNDFKVYPFKTKLVKA